MTVNRIIHLVRIQGIGTVDGQTSYCFPDVPAAYATDDYVRGLAERPQTTSGIWDTDRHHISRGRGRVLMDRRVGPVNWWRINPDPITELYSAVTAAAGTLPLMVLGTIAVDDVIYLGTESCLVTAVTPGAAPDCDVTRGYAGSIATTHPAGEDIYDVPPALPGRLFELWEVDREAAADTEETLIQTGTIASEASWDEFWATLQVDTLWDPEVGRDDQSIAIDIETLSLLTHGPGPRGGDSGGGYWINQNGEVVSVAYASDRWVHGAGELVMWGGTPGDADPKSNMILLSDVNGPYPPFGRYDKDTVTWTPSDQPQVITLNLLMSIDGANYDADDPWRYDLGAYSDTWGSQTNGLYPGYSAALIRTRVDVPAFEELITGRLAAIRASRLWLQASAEEKLWDVIERINATVGIAIGAGRDGIVKPISLGDTYGSYVAAITKNHIMKGSISHQVMSRTIDSITINASPGPDGESWISKTVNEASGARLYPRQIGQSIELDLSPYDSTLFVGDYSAMTLIVKNQITRGARRSLKVTLEVKGSMYGVLDIGDAVSVHSAHIDNPSTGVRLAATDDPLSGRVVAVDSNIVTRTDRISVVVWTEPNNALWSAGATVTAVVDKTITVNQDDYSHAIPYDPKRFDVGDVVVLVDSHFVPRTDHTGVHMSTVTGCDETHVTVDQWEDTAGNPVVPAATDILVYAGYDEVAAAQLTGHAWMADGGARGTTPTVATGIAPWEYGD